MKRLLGTPPGAGYNLALLREQARGAWGDMRDVNEVETTEVLKVDEDGNPLETKSTLYLAIYFKDDEYPIEDEEWQALLDAHDGSLKTAEQIALEQRQDDFSAVLDGIEARLAKCAQYKSGDEVQTFLVENQELILKVLRHLVR